MDSTPTEQGPPSMIHLIRPSKSIFTCSAVVGLGRPTATHKHTKIKTSSQSVKQKRQRENDEREPDKFAEGAASGS